MSSDEFVGRIVLQLPNRLTRQRSKWNTRFSLRSRLDCITVKCRMIDLWSQIFADRNRKAFEITDTELKLIAALAIIGLSNQ